jgi:hypothetical protein
LLTLSKLKKCAVCENNVLILNTSAAGFMMLASLNAPEYKVVARAGREELT